MGQVAQVVGALLILGGYTANQLHGLDPRSYPYLALNLIGSAILGVLAFAERQWGFVLLESVWALVSLWGLLTRALGRADTPLD